MAKTKKTTAKSHRGSQILRTSYLQSDQQRPEIHAVDEDGERSKGATGTKRYSGSVHKSRKRQHRSQS